jgi:P-type Ca2+ transporter type 2C
MNDSYRREPAAVLRDFDVDAAVGLTGAEALRRSNQYGKNELTEHDVKKPWLILWEQMTASVVVVLVVAAVVSALLGDYKDSVAIIVIVILNASLGFSQEYRAEKAVAALKKLAVPRIKVRRGGEVLSMCAVGLVPGDIVLLEAGNAVAADCRILESVGLQTLESALTGESEPIDKIPDALDRANLALGDRRNMVYLGTFVTAGRGLAVVTATGMRTELGQVARMIRTVKHEPTPLQQRLQHVGKVLAGGALFFVALIFVQGLFRGESVKLMFLTAVSIGVAAVPEGLPAVVTIALALGAQRMLKRKALIRKLPAVETLGSVTTICSDKTGTLTENQMRVATLQVAEDLLDLTKSSRSGLLDESIPISFHASGVALLLAGGALCNDAHVGTGITPLGDPTETALVAAAAGLGLFKTELERLMPRVAEVPFSSERKRMTTIHEVPCDSPLIPKEIVSACGETPTHYLAFTKGAVDNIVQRSATIWLNGSTQPLGPEWGERLITANDALAKRGMRVIGVVFRCLSSLPKTMDPIDVERDMTFVGMFGLIDPPRQEVASAVAICKMAGIRPVMITGDHPRRKSLSAAQNSISSQRPS